MKRVLSLVLMFALLLTHVPRALATPPDGGNEQSYATGLIWDSWETIEANLREDPPSVYESVLPTSVDLTAQFPTPRSQGAQNSCVAWAFGYALKSRQEDAKRGWGLHTDEHLFSPSYIYNQKNGGHDSGMGMVTAINVLEDQGICTLASFPYNQLDYTTQPTAEQRAEAALYKVDNQVDNSWYFVRGIDNIKRRLADGDGVVIGIVVYPDFNNLRESNPIYDEVSGSRGGGHAVCLVGYDDEKKAFKFINSWGTGWGLGGYGWISYDLMNNVEVNHHGVMVGFVMEAPIVYEKHYEYTVSDEQATITRYLGPGGDIVIPDTLGGYPVTAISARFPNDYIALITGITIPASVDTIGDIAFYECTALLEVRFLGDAPPNLGNNLFGALSHSFTIYYPTHASGWTTPMWNGYRAEPFDAFIDSGTCGDDLTWTLDISGILAISGTGEMWDYDSTPPPWDSLRGSIKTIIINNGVTGISDTAFADCKSLRTARFLGNAPSGFGGDVFTGSHAGFKIYYPASASGWSTPIWNGYNAEPWRHSVAISPLTKGSITANPTKAAAGEIVTLIIVPDSDYRLKADTLKYNNIAIDVNSFVMPEENVNITAIFEFDPVFGSGTCGDNLTWIFDSGILTISGTGSMWDFPRRNSPWSNRLEYIHTVIIDNGVTSIGSEAFYNCSALTKVTIAEGVETIGWYAFYNCSALTNVIIPNSVTYIESGAFSTFYETHPKNLTIHCYKTSYAHIYAVKNRIPIVLIDCDEPLIYHYTLSNSEAAIIRYDGIGGDVVIPDTLDGYSVTEVGEGAFYACMSLTSVVIPDSVKTIGAGTFFFCLSLTDVVIPNSVTTIGDSAFHIPSFSGYGNPDTPIPNLTIHCYENSYAHSYAIENNIPFLLFKPETKTIEVSQLPNNEDIAVNHIKMTSAIDGSYSLAVDFEKAGEVLFFFVVYEGNMLTKTYIADGNAEIKGIAESDLLIGKICIWDKNMQPCIESTIIPTSI